MKKSKKSFELTAEEKQLESEIEKGEWRSLSREKVKEMKNSLESYAKAQKKDARVNLRLNQEDVLRIRQKSEKEGIPYQTLIASTLHKFATDQLLDQDAVRLVVETAIFKKPRYVP